MFDKPHLGGGIGREELHQLFSDFLLAGIGWVRAILAKILALVRQIVELSPFLAVGPQVRPPQQQRRLARRVAQRFRALDLRRQC